MKCCKAEEFENWCAGVPIYKHNGKHYCKFHLPIGAVGKPETDEFNELVYKLIKNDITFDRSCNLSGIHFPGAIDFGNFDNEKPMPAIDFSYATFGGYACFKSTTFNRRGIFRWAKFNGNADFNEAAFNGYASFEHAQFKDYAGFKDAVFSDDANYERAVFYEDTEFWFTAFGGNTYFESAAFSGKADFREAAFNKKADFSEALFHKDAIFNLANFEEEADFNEATFSGDAEFSKAKFRLGAHFNKANLSSNGELMLTSFTNAEFSENAQFREACFNGRTHFNEAAFAGDADFNTTEFSIYAIFSKTEFGCDADFRKADFSGRYTYFSDAVFKGETSFEEATADNSICFSGTRFGRTANFQDAELVNAEFDGCHFEMQAYFRRTWFHGASFKDCTAKEHLDFRQADLTRVSLLNAPLENFRFIDCAWPTSKGLSTVYDARRAPYHPGEAFQAEKNLPAKTVGFANLDSPNIVGAHETFPDPASLQDIFRQLKKYAKEEHDEFLTASWHYWEKEMLRIKHWQSLGRIRSLFFLSPVDLFTFLILQIYRYLSDYGESWLRAGAWLLAAPLLPVLAGTLVTWLLDVWPQSLSPDWGVLSEVNRWFPPDKWSDWLPIVKLADAPREPLGEASRGPLGDLMVGLYRLLVTGQAALFLLALRNKMRR